MKLRRTVLLATVATAFACAGRAGAQSAAAAPAPTTGRYGLMYGNGFGFGLTAPGGWVLDAQAGRVNGVAGVFYRQGESWRDGLAVMYASSMSKAESRVSTAEEAATADAAKQRAEEADLVVTEAPGLPTSDGRTAVVRYFRAPRLGNVEAVAYVNEDSVVAIVALTARSDAGFQAALPAFAKLVASYDFVGPVRLKPADGGKQ